jgi:hypothetical protein
VTVTRTLPPVLGAGVHTLRVVADTLGTVVETDESDNTQTRALTVVSGDGPDERPPGFLAGPIPLPAGVTASVLWKNDEPTTGVVRYGPTPAFGDSATAPLDTTHTATLDGLTLGAKYFYQVVVRDTASNPAAAPIDSFLTPSGPLGTDDPPLRFALSGARPNPSSGGVAFTLELPVESAVGFDVLDVQGRRVWREPERRIGAGVWTLSWNRAGPAGPGPGLYFARISVNGQPHVKRFAIVR